MGIFTVIIPTLNEEENVDKLLERVFRVRSSLGLEFDVLFVDSASEDGTCRKIEGWQNDHPVKLLRSELNLGLAGAVMAGAHYTQRNYLLVMDADLSHPPEIIPELIHPVLDGSCDMVVGSRYVRGGSMPGWPMSRRVSSMVATLPALLFCDIKDPLAGFFSVSRQLMTSLPKDVPGFKIALALLAENQGNLRVKEVPIEFRDRGYGESKMDRRVVLDYLKQLGQLTMNKVRR